MERRPAVVPRARTPAAAVACPPTSRVASCRWRDGCHTSEDSIVPLARRLPYKRGFNRPGKIIYQPVNVGDLAGFEEGTEVDPVVLTVVGLLDKPDVPLVILGDGELDVALTVKAHRFSKSARQKIEAAGGSVEVLPLEQE